MNWKKIVAWVLAGLAVGGQLAAFVPDHWRGPVTALASALLLFVPEVQKKEADMGGTGQGGEH